MTIQKFLAAVLFVLWASAANATNVDRLPLAAAGTVAPNIIFGMDDSGSMDLEVMLETNEGLFWWDTSTKSGWSSTGAPLFNSEGLASAVRKPFAHLFPVGCTPAATGGGGKRLCDANGVYTAPPTAQFATLRSSDYNPIYYNPAVTYKPWAPATISGRETSFSNSNSSAALAHPLFSAPTLDLTSVQSSTAGEWVFQAFSGMTMPAGAQYWNGRKWVALTSSATVGSTGALSGTAYSMAMDYYPATYWVKEACVVDGVTCARAPGGAIAPTLRRYEIRNDGTKFPSGRTYAEELQNFANWFTYYRKRKLMLAASMGEVLVTTGLSGLRLGLTEFNTRSSSYVQMYDSNSADALSNSKVVAGLFYGNLALGGTPTRNTMRFIGDQFNTAYPTNPSKNIVQASCQRNAMFLVTDGFANATSVTVPAYDVAKYGGKAPYSTTFQGTLADLGLAYYTNVLRSDLPMGRVPAAAASSTNPAADRNPNLHVNTYAITLGARGKLWPGAPDPYKTAPAWVNPTSNGMPEAIDDLWHATINGRGAMFLATTPAETAEQIQAALTAIRNEASAQSGVNFSSVNFQGTSTVAYLTGFNGDAWSGDLTAHKVLTTTGEMSKEWVWSANAQLNSRDWTTRAIFTAVAGTEVLFTDETVGSKVNAGGYAGSSAAVVNYLRGNRAGEGSSFRKRTGVMGAIVSAGATVDATQGVVYAPSGDGMLHAFDATSGVELWAYVPEFVLPNMGDQSKLTYAFQTKLDGTPVIAKVGQKRLLVATAGRAGPGVYALDVTTPRLPSSGLSIASQVKAWEFPSASTSATHKANLGVQPGRPVVVNTTKYGWVVLVTSGYNTTGDGKGRLFVLDAGTGEVKAVLTTTEGSAAAPAGLAAPSAYLEADGKSRYVYAGDELGFMWKFDVESGAVLKLATAKTAGNVAQPLTTPPELAAVGGRRMVFFGTGRLLSATDMNSNEQQSFYAVADLNSSVTRRDMAVRTLTMTGDYRTVSGSAVNWGSQKGWVLDLPLGELANTEPSVASGVLAFTTNKPSALQCAAESALYVTTPDDGLQLPDSAFVTEPFFGKKLGATLTNDVRLTRLVSGRIGAFTRQSDGSSGLEQLIVGKAADPRMLGWREVLR